MTEAEIRADERKLLAAIFLKTTTMHRVSGAMSQYPTEYSEDVPMWANGKEIARAILGNMKGVRAIVDERTKLRAALKPFAQIADLVNHTDIRDGECVMRLPCAGRGPFTLVREDFKRAAAAFNNG